MTRTLTLRALARTTTLFLASALAAGTLLTGCDSGSDDAYDGEPVAPGTFAAHATGAVRADLDGLAAFDDGLESETGEAVFAVGLVSGDSADAVVLVGRGEARERTYALSADDEAGEAGALYLRTEGEDGALYVATSGTLTLTDVGEDRLRGWFRLTALGAFDETTRVTLEGSFDAPRGEVEPEPVAN